MLYRRLAAGVSKVSIFARRSTIGWKEGCPRSPVLTLQSLLSNKGIDSRISRSLGQVSVSASHVDHCAVAGSVYGGEGGRSTEVKQRPREPTEDSGRFGLTDDCHVVHTTQ